MQIMKRPKQSDADIFIAWVQLERSMQRNLRRAAMGAAKEALNNAQEIVKECRRKHNARQDVIDRMKP